MEKDCLSRSHHRYFGITFQNHVLPTPWCREACDLSRNSLKATFSSTQTPRRGTKMKVDLRLLWSGIPDSSPCRSRTNSSRRPLVISVADILACRSWAQPRVKRSHNERGHREPISGRSPFGTRICSAKLFSSVQLEDAYGFCSATTAQSTRLRL